MLAIYTDGCCLNNQAEENYGGWAFVAVKPSSKLTIGSGEAKNTTNQRMELLACIEAMEFGLQESEEHIKIITDSSYVTNCVKDGWYLKWMNNGWVNSKQKPVKNKDLWEKFITLLEQRYFDFYHVKGHSGNKYNELADLSAKRAAQEYKARSSNYGN